MKKKLILITTCLLTIALILGACDVTPAEQEPPEHKHTYATGWMSNENYHWHAATCEHSGEQGDKAAHSFNSDNKCTVCSYKKVTPAPTKTAEEAIAEYLVSLGDNFSVSANLSLSENFQDIVKGGHDYILLADGNKLYADNDGEEYYLEECDDGSVYVYTQQEGEWHKELVTEEYNRPDDITEMLTLLLGNVEWYEYNEQTGVAKGYIELEGHDFDIKFTMKSDGATVVIYLRQYVWGDLYAPVQIGYAKIYDIGSTTVTLPELHESTPDIDG